MKHFYTIQLKSGGKVTITADKMSQGDLAVIFTNVNPAEDWGQDVVAVFAFNAIEYIIVNKV